MESPDSRSVCSNIALYNNTTTTASTATTTTTTTTTTYTSSTTSTNISYESIVEYKIENDTMTISNGNHSFVRLVVATLSLIVTSGNADECHLCYREDRFISTLILQNVVLSRIAIFVNRMN